MQCLVTTCWTSESMDYHCLFMGMRYQYSRDIQLSVMKQWCISSFQNLLIFCNVKRYKLDWKNVLIDGNFVGLFYSQPGECHQHFALLEYLAGDEEDMVEDVRLLYELKLESLESFEVLQNSTISWHLKNDSLFRLTQRFTGRKMQNSLLHLVNDGDELKPNGFWKIENDCSKSGMILIHKYQLSYCNYFDAFMILHLKCKS